MVLLLSFRNIAGFQKDQRKEYLNSGMLNTFLINLLNCSGYLVPDLFIGILQYAV